MQLSPPDPTLTVENLLGVMEKMTDGRVEEVWERLINNYDMLKDVSSKCSTERELVSTCADIYVNCNPDSSWEEIACRLYRDGETAAVEEAQSYLNPRGRFSQWVWFVVYGVVLTFIVLEDTFDRTSIATNVNCN